MTIRLTRLRVVHIAALALGCILLLDRASAPRRIVAQAPDNAFVERALASLTPEERVGQLVMVNFVEDDVSASSDIAALIRDYRVGAVLVTASNGNVVNRGDTAGQLATLTNGLQQRSFEASARTDSANGQYFLPLFVATDNEGDLFPLTNVTNGFTAVPNNMTIGATWSKKDAQATGAIVGRELSAAGINMLLGPVVDVLGNPRSGGNGDIGIRSFGGDPAWVGQLGRAYVRGVHEGSADRMLTVTKHFPGHGSSDRGTDNEVPTVNKSLSQLRASDLAPFAEAVRADDTDAAGATDAMMVSHIRYRNFVPGATTPFTRPISIDAAAFKALMDLPEFVQWRASHLVMSDALGVQAVKQWYAQQGLPDFPNRDVVRDALLAGSDLLPLVEFYEDPDHPGWNENQLPVIQDSITYMREQYASDPDFRRRADDAVRRVIAAKIKLYPQLQLAQVRADPVAAAAAVGGGEEQMRTLAEDALTLLQPQTVPELRARLPRGPVTPDKVLIVECWEDCYPYRIMAKAALQNRLLALYGTAGSARLKPEDVTTISYGELDAWLAKPSDAENAQTALAVTDASWIILALTEYNPVGRPVSGAAKRLLQASPIDLRNKNLVGIAYNVPYHLDSTEISKLSAYFAVYSKTEVSIDTGFRALFGDVTPKGHPPVNVGGIFYNVADAVQPDPSQQLNVAVFGQQPDNVSDARTVALVSGQIIDKNGNPVPDGTSVAFELARTGGVSVSATGATSDGFAGAQLALNGGGAYAASIRVAGVTAASQPLPITVIASAAPESTPASVPTTTSSTSGGDSGSNALVLALVIGVPSALGLAAVGLVGSVVYRRRRAHSVGVGVVTAPPTPEAAPPSDLEPPALRVDSETRRVYVKGVEMRPALSGEQFRLLSYLYQRAGKVVAREELVLQVWPDAHAEGVSEEALDALVRRVRERLAQAGGERSYIVTLRGQGFRLDASTTTAS